MKKTIIWSYVAGFFLVVMLSGTCTANAQVPVTKMDQLKAEIEARKEALAEKRASTTAEYKLKTLCERIAETAKLSKIHFTAELNRLLDIKNKIDSRMAKLSQAGANLSTTTSDLGIAVSALNVAQTKISEIDANDSTSTPSEKIWAFRQSVTNVQNSIDSAQGALSQVVSDMKNAEGVTK